MARRSEQGAPSGRWRPDERLQVDVLVVGAGLAGMEAALACLEEGVDTALVCKGPLDATGNTALASGGLAVALGFEHGGLDSPVDHAADTVRAGAWLNDQDLVWSFCHEAPQAIERLLSQGARFVAEDDRPKLFSVPGHRAKRSVRCLGGGTANLVGPLSARLLASGVRIVSDAWVADVLLDDQGRAAGAVAFLPASGRWLLLRARAIVLAAGGLGQLFPLTSNSDEACGDGYAMALRAGCELTGMEFIQFTPTAVAFPAAVRGISTGGAILAQEGVRLLNARGERFMEHYDPVRLEGSTRDVVARAIHREVVEGRGNEHGAVYLDMSQVDPAAVAAVSGKFVARMATVGVDPMRDPIEIAPEVHFCMGGVRIGLHGETGIPNLFCAGEVAGGLHGANRLNSNGLTEASVFGWRTGKQAATCATARPSGEPASGWRPPTAGGVRRLELGGLRSELRTAMFAAAGIERDAGGLTEGRRRILALSERIESLAPRDPAEVVQSIELRNMCRVADCVLTSAYERGESRGAHYRTDCPQTSSTLYTCEVRLAGGVVSVKRYPVRLSRFLMDSPKSA